jgi:hypothetical protein
VSAPPAVAAPTPPRHVRPTRGERAVDDLGAGPVALGMDLAELQALGLDGQAPKGYARFTQNGKPQPITVRFGRTLYLTRDGVDQLAVEVNPVQMRAASMRVVGRLFTTPEAVGVGTSLAELRRRYGPPLRTTRPWSAILCAQFTQRPGIDFCVVDFPAHDSWDALPEGAALSELRIPASVPGPLALGSDLAALTARLQDRVLGGGVVNGDRLTDLDDPARREPVSLSAPCMLRIGERTASMSERPVVVRGGEVYQMSGGWREPSGAMTVCFLGGLFEVDADGETRRWTRQLDSWTPEPARCEVAEKRVHCRGTTDAFPFVGVLEGDLVVDADAWRDLRAHRAMRVGTIPDLRTSAGWCRLLYERAWTELEPSLTFVGAHKDEGAHLRFLVMSQDDHDWCAHNPPEVLGCAALSPSVLAAPRVCKRDPLLVSWSWRRFAPPEPPMPALSASEAASRAARLVGTWSWRTSWGPRFDRTWQVSAGGRRMKIRGGPDEGDYTVAFASRGAMWIDSPAKKMKMTVAFVDQDHFYAFDERLTEVPDRTHFRLAIERANLNVFVRGDSCKTISGPGILADASCAFTARAGEPERFTVDYIDENGKPGRARFNIYDDVLAPEEANPPLVLFERVHH